MRPFVSRMFKTGCRRHCGFTLTELLIVIAIIAVLAGLLLPVLANARDSARTAQCCSNLKQMNTIAELYSAASDNYLPPQYFPADSSSPQDWTRQGKPQPGKWPASSTFVAGATGAFPMFTHEFFFALTGDLAEMTIWRCPAHTPSDQMKPYYAGGRLSNLPAGWPLWQDKWYVSSYMTHPCFLPAKQGCRGDFPGLLYERRGATPLTIEKLVKSYGAGSNYAASQHVLYLEGHGRWPGGAFVNWNVWKWWEHHPRTPPEIPATNGRYDVAGHGSNMSFADGHVKYIQDPFAQDLWLHLGYSGDGVGNYYSSPPGGVAQKHENKP